MTLIDAEDDDALLLPREEAAKVYTARTAEKLEWRRDCILAMIGWGMPVDSIAAKAHCSTRIVRLLGAKYSTVAAQSAQEMCKVLGSLAMKAAFHIDQNMSSAKVGEAAVVMGISLQRKQEMEAINMGAYDANAGAVDVETDDPRRAAFIERLKQLAAPKAIPA